MQPAEAQKGVSTKSQLLDSLKVYLNKKDRLQPIIGLGSIIECVKTCSREALYLCEVCVCRLSKADIRSHIMGSLHRYNYIKAWHPHMVSEWKEDSDLSVLAWPLMEKAKILEGREGPGDVQLLEVGDAVYQRMATCSEIDAITLIKMLSDGQGEPETHSEIEPVQLEHSPIQSQRIVFLGQNTQSKNSTNINQPPFLTESTVAPSVKSEGWFNTNSSLLDDYKGTKPLIGLFHVVECKNEDGCTYCFLCHCCRKRTNKRGIIDHLTSSSHRVKYLMETHPEQVELMMADINDNSQLLQSLARKVEQEEGRGELKVVNAPQSLCVRLTNKSYNWCVRKLRIGWTHTNIQKRKIAEEGPCVNKTLCHDMPQKSTGMLSEGPKMKKRKVSNTVFKVGLPLTKGSVLLERASFSGDSLPVSSAYSPPSNSDPIPSPQSEDCELDCDTGSFAVKHTEHTSEFTASQFQQGLYSGDTDTGIFMGSERNGLVDSYSSDNQYDCQSGYITGTKDPMSCWELNYNRKHGSQESSSNRFYKEGQSEGALTQNECLLPAASEADDWSSYNAFYGHEEGFTAQWYNSTYVSREERRKEMSSDATQCYHQQQSHEYMAQDHAGPLTDSGGHCGFSEELAPQFDAARISTHPHVGDSLADSGNTSPEARVQFPSHRPTYMEFNINPVQTTQQIYMMQPMPHQVIHVGHGVVSDLDYNIGTNPDQHRPHPSVLWRPHWS